MNKKSAHVMNWRNRAKLRLIEYKGGRCERCGYCKPIPAAYDFHHPNPAQKDFMISGKSWGFDRLKAEADKCVLLCKNCHAEVHYELSQEARSKRKEIGKGRLCAKSCQHCNAIFQPKRETNRYCSERCYRLHSRKTTRPSRAKLSRELRQMSWTAIGKQYGVSDNAVRKWARQYGIMDR
jgi:hypothetical protein